MVSRGFTVLMLGTTCYVLAVASQIGWLYLFAAFIWSAGAVSLFLPWLNLRCITASRLLLGAKEAQPQAKVPPFAEDDDLEIGIIIRNNSRFPKYLLRIEESCPIEEPDKQAKSFFLTSLGPRESVTARYHVRCYQRGEFTFPPVAVEAISPFGIFRLRKEFPAPLSVLVYPACYPFERLPLAGDTLSNHGIRFNLRASSLSCGCREYQRGDSLRHIHWRNSARRNRLMVKEFEENFRGSLAITFDTSHNFGQGKESTLEYAIKIASSVIRYCTSRGMRVHLLPGRGPHNPEGTSFRAAMDFLAKLQPRDEANLNELPVLPQVPCPTLAIVSLADRRRLGKPRELEKRNTRLIIVALSGFTERELSGAALSELARYGAPIIMCPRGELQTALKELESINWATVSPTTGVRIG